MNNEPTFVPHTKKTDWLILKNGMWYRPDASGYTSNPAEAGRYTYGEAMSHSHPNGPDGPRDGMSIHEESKVTNAHVEPADDLLRQAIEALRKARMFIENGTELGYIRLPDDGDPALKTLPAITAALTAYDKREQS